MKTESTTHASDTSIDRAILDAVVSAYLKSPAGPEIPEWIGKSYTELEAQGPKHDTIHILESIQNTCARELARLKRLRNEDLSPIHRLPPEIFLKIIVLSIDWTWWTVEQLRVVASVSVFWRDAILSYNRLWSPIDVMASAEARRVAMKRNPAGPIDVWCWNVPSLTTFESYMKDLDDIQGDRRPLSVLHDCRQEHSRFQEWMRSHNADIVDLFLANMDLEPAAAYVELPEGGLDLKHIDLFGIGLPWDSSRLGNLRMISLRAFRHNIPRLDQLYNMLSSSTRLELLCLTDIVLPEEGSIGSLPAEAKPISLPYIETIALQDVPIAIPASLVPLLRAPMCRTIVIDGQGDDRALLEPVQATMDLITESLAPSKKLTLSVLGGDQPHVHILSEPVIRSPQQWVYWAHERPGVDVKLALPSPDVLTWLWSQISRALEGRDGSPILKTLAVQLPESELESSFPFPFSVLEKCPPITNLEVTDRSGSSLLPLIRALGANPGDTSSPLTLPNLKSLTFFTIANLDQEECLNAITSLLETRYPVLEGNRREGSEWSALEELRLPPDVAQALLQREVSTSLNLTEVVRETEA